jgi:hypothetical protein
MPTNRDREPARADAEIQRAMDTANRLTEKLRNLLDRQTEVENSRSSFNSESAWDAAVDAIERDYEQTSEDEREAESEFQRILAYWNEDADDDRDQD